MVIVFEHADGTVSVAYPVRPIREGETQEEYIAAVATKAAKHLTRPHRAVVSMDQTLIPTRGGKKMFREAWRLVDGRLHVDLPAARSVKLAQIRKDRNEKLAESDAERSKLDDIGTGPQKQALAAYRQALRDLPATLAIDGLTAEQLHDFKPNWPAHP